MSDEKKIFTFKEFEEMWNDMLRYGDDQSEDNLEVVKNLVLIPMFKENCGGKVSNFKFVTSKGQIELLPGEMVIEETEAPEEGFLAALKASLQGFFSGKEK